jgi:hypothetical protein
MFIEVKEPRRLINVDSLDSFELQNGRIVAYSNDKDSPGAIVIRSSTNNAQLEKAWDYLAKRLEAIT